MLLNGVHLLPDLSGALVCPKVRLLAVSDPVGDTADRAAPQRAATAVRHLAGLLRQRRPATVLWLGPWLPSLWMAGTLPKREADELARLVAAHDWQWIADELPEGLPGSVGAEVTLAGLTFRHAAAQTGAPVGEVSALPWPVAGMDGRSWPCFVSDGRRMVLPAFGGAQGHGVNVLAPSFLRLFRRPFHALVLAGNRIVTRPRARLEPPAPPPAPPVE